MDLKMGGIYTETDDYIDIILNEKNDRCFVVEIDNADYNFCSNLQISNFLKQLITDMIDVKTFPIYHVFTFNFDSNIDGYLGQISDELYANLLNILEAKEWYQYY